ncbi:MAG: FecR family protein [Spirochaetota bacterium]
MMKMAISLSFFVFIVLMAPVVLFSVNVEWVKGDVRYSHLKGEWSELAVGMNLVSGDMVKTGIASETVLIENGGEILILENSTFTVSERYVQETQKSSFMLFLGRMRFKLGKASRVEPEIQTQSVNLAIRGTDVEVGSGYDGSTIVLTNEGSVAVQGKTRTLILAQGEGTEVGFGEEPVEKFNVMTRVINWDEWFSSSQEAVKGNELRLLERILEKFGDIQNQIKQYEDIRERALREKDQYISERDRLLTEGKKEEAGEYSRKAGEKSKLAYHSFVNIRFLALSSIGLNDMGERVYKGVVSPSDEMNEIYGQIQKIYKGIEDKYILEEDRERLEKRAQKKKGCIKLF